MERTTVANLGITPFDVQLRRETQRHLWFSRFKGSITKENDYNNDPVLRASGSPIEVNHKLKSLGIGDRLLIPMQKDLAGAPTLGDAVLIGREESTARAYAKVGYNQVRHAVVKLEGEMANNREAALNAAQYHMSDLARWHAMYENYNILTAIYEGASENLYTSKTNEDYGQGLGIPKRFHPNMYSFTGATDGAAVLTRIGSIANKFPNAAEVYTAANAATQNCRPMSTRTVKRARLLAMRLNIKPLVTESGLKFWPWLITPEQAYSLMTDETFVKALQAPAWSEHKTHPWLTGAIGYFGGFVFFEDVLSVRGFSGTSGTDLNVLGSVNLVANEQDKTNPRFLPQLGHITCSNDATKSNNVGIIFGESFLGESFHDALSFRTDDADYQNWKGLAAVTKYGYERLDFVPESQVSALEGTEAQAAAITGVYNTSSLLIMTWEETRS